MQRNDEFSRRNLSRLFSQTPVEELRESDRVVIFSDLHLGNGSRTDDFAWNSDMFLHVLREHYQENGYSLILNGDIEELQRFSLTDIRARWESVYELFDEFRQQGRLRRLVGNHDMDLLRLPEHDFDVRHALRFSYHGDTLFVFHGHQTSVRFEKYNHLVGFGLRYFANPLKITNYSVAHDSQKRFRTEQRVYEFASSNQLMAIIGHTHRPLFESMSKIDSIKFEIERLCRKYPKASARKQRAIEHTISRHKSELGRIRESGDETASVASLYNANLLIPCMFNSGTVVGERGMTCLELRDGGISLAHWFDEKRSRKYLQDADYSTEALPGTGYHRVEIKSDTLEYIFTRIRLLAGA
jgi:UDP-2,3-diacylglucosamine pyrophosphatase LpxH